MAAGEYVSVSSQRHRASGHQSRHAELEDNVEGEKRELAAIYVRRGLDTTLAKQVAEQLMAKDALEPAVMNGNQKQFVPDLFKQRLRPHYRSRLALFSLISSSYRACYRPYHLLQ